MKNQDPTNDDALTDHSLLKRFRKGEGDAATELYVRYASRLQALAWSQTSPVLAARFDPEDVVQSVFRTFFRRVSEGMYDVPAGEQLWQLLLVLALNKVRGLGSHHRAQKRDVTRTVEVNELDGLTHSETALHTLQLVIEEVLEEMSPAQRQIIQLRIEGHEVRPIAEQTKRSKRTVERILQSFRQKLAKLIDEPQDPARST